jgi:hypothetical protein
VKGVPTFFADRLGHATAGSRNTGGVNRQSKWALKLVLDIILEGSLILYIPEEVYLKTHFHNGYSRDRQTIY